MTTTPTPESSAGASVLDLRDDDPYVVVERSASFRDLRRRFRRFVFPMGAFFLGYYLLLIYAAGWHRAWMATPVLGAVNIGTIFALSEFATTFAIAWIYTRYSDRILDPSRDRLRLEVETLQATRPAPVAATSTEG